jgi:hypothetical protein
VYIVKQSGKVHVNIEKSNYIDWTFDNYSLMFEWLDIVPGSIASD